MREFVRKGSTMTVEELKAHLGMAKPRLRILCSRQFGLRLVVEQAFKELGYSDALKAIDADSRTHFSIERAVFAMVLQKIVSPVQVWSCWYPTQGCGTRTRTQPWSGTIT